MDICQLCLVVLLARLTIDMPLVPWTFGELQEWCVALNLHLVDLLWLCRCVLKLLNYLEFYNGCAVRLAMVIIWKLLPFSLSWYAPVCLGLILNLYMVASAF